MLRKPSELEIVFGSLSVAGMVACATYVVSWAFWDLTADAAFWVSLIVGVVFYELQLLVQIPEGGDTR